MDSLNQRKWDRAARTYDLMSGYGAERRWEPYKRRLFSLMWGKVLFVAIGDRTRYPLLSGAAEHGRRGYQCSDVGAGQAAGGGVPGNDRVATCGRP